jgi:2-polyprenyl-3-methyl-5-hydroxy-6-metoxy-1,4-benzoquinol methylase
MMNIRSEGLKYLKTEYPILGKAAFQGSESAYLEYTSSYLEQVQLETGLSIEIIMDGYAKTCFEFMKLQNNFLKTGQYAATSQRMLESNLYANVEAMESYLLGLLSTYLYWENHSKIFDFYCEKFSLIAEQVKEAKTMEIGTGHGLFASYLLEKNPTMSYLGIDISVSSLNFSRKLLNVKFIDREIDLVQQDATSSDFSYSKKYDFVICCEVLEHVEEPAKLLENIRSSMNKNGKAFITTVSNLEAVDHIFLFKNSEEIRNMIKNTGFTILEEGVFKLSSSTSQIEQSNYAAVISPAPTF